MIQLRHEFDVAASPERVWSLVSDLDAFARCVPTVVDYRCRDADHASGTVGVTLGALPVRSRVEIEILERKPLACLRGRAVSYLGETIATQLRAGKPGTVVSDDVGTIDIHLDLRPGAGGGTRLVFLLDVDARGKLERIYQAIIRLKADGMKTDFEARLRKALDGHEAVRGAHVPEPAPEPHRPAHAFVRAYDASSALAGRALDEARRRWTALVESGSAKPRMRVESKFMTGEVEIQSMRLDAEGLVVEGVVQGMLPMRVVIARSQVLAYARMLPRAVADAVARSWRGGADRGR